MTTQTESRLKCGEVFTWNCAGEAYAIECGLCEERPLCTLAEFAEHMDIWHSSWEEAVSKNGNVELEAPETEPETEDEDDNEAMKWTTAATEEHEEKELRLIKRNVLIGTPLEHSSHEILVVKDAEMMNLEREIQLAKTQLQLDCIENNAEHLAQAALLEPFEQVLIASDEETDLMTDHHREYEYKDGDEEGDEGQVVDRDESQDVDQYEDQNDDQYEDQDERADEAVEEAEDGAVDEPEYGAVEEAEVAHQNVRQVEAEVQRQVEHQAKEQEEQHAHLDIHASAHNNGDSNVDDCTHKSLATSDFTDTEPESIEQTLQDDNEFGLNEHYSNAKLTKEHVEKLIDLYRSHPRIWNQTHPEYSETHLSRESWQDITQKWNQFCHKSFSTTDVRIRVSTLCQRYMRERQRLEDEGELDESGKFVHYEKLQFLDEQQVLQSRRLVFEKQNAKLLEIYAHFPLLWHTRKKHIKHPTEREKSLSSISTALELCGIYLSAYAVQRRIKALRKCYRIEKIRFLHSRVEQRSFETNFKHYAQMQFLDRHIDPYVCAVCGKIFENLLGFRQHVNNENHGDWSAEEQEEEEKEEESDLEKEEIEIEEEVWQENQLKENNVPHVVVANTPAPQEPAAVPINLNITFSNENTVASEQEFALESPMQVAHTKVMNTSHELHKLIDEIIACDEVPLETAGEIQPTIPTTIQELPTTLVATVECAAVSYDLNLNVGKDNEPDSTTATTSSSSTSTEIEEKDMPLDIRQSFARLTVEQTHKLIALYKQQPQLWDPNNLDFQSRKQRRFAWRNLTTKLNKRYKMRYGWKTLHRKLTDYAKYYKREKSRIEKEGSCTKWCFYDDFAFLDDVIAINTELQKSLQHKDNNLRIIEIYKAHPQLWDTHHSEYTKRKVRQRYIESMCGKLQEECNLQITPEKLKQRLIEFRNQYRAAKEQRIAALQRNETFTPSYDFYEPLQYLELHVAPFICSLCGASFKRHTDFVQHERRLHASTASSGGGRSKRPKADDNENVCHICGMTFTLRSNLVYHLQRHVGARTHACTHCPKRFFNSTSLRVHERSHTKNYPCVCEHCGRKFVNASKLNQHAKRHRNQRDFPCDRCDKAFYSSFERERHLRRHLQIRDKVCEVCGKAFVVGSAYYAHKMLHADVKKYECVQCNVRFAQYAGLYKHRKKYHPL